jgi:DNA-binding CsgD family transcriptional regulator
VARRRRRLVAAAEHHVAAGDPSRAREILEGLVPSLGAGPERAALLWRLADTIGDTLDEPIRLCEQALVEAEGDPALTSEVHTALGVFTWIAGDLSRATEHCREAARFAEAAGDEQRLAVAIGEACHAEAVLGVPWDREAMTRALELEQQLEELPPSLRPSFQLAIVSLVTDDLVTARPLLETALARARRTGDEPGTFTALFRLAELELRAGNLAEALAGAGEAVVLTRQGGVEQEQATTEMALALALAHVGELDKARQLADSARRVSEAGGDRAVAIRCAGVLGFVEVSAGEPERALGWLTPAREELEAMGTGELSIYGVVQNELEALVATGSLDRAEAVIAFVEAKGRLACRAWHRAVGLRGRALVASARGDVAAAQSAVEEALATHASVPQPFELARTLFAAGAVERRSKHWAAARRHFTDALELCDDLGAAVWAERAASELARLPGRRPRSQELTETERQVAELVAAGLPNKVVATRLFVSVRAVEANLSRVYAKLGVRSRTELTRKLAG